MDDARSRVRWRPVDAPEPQLRLLGEPRITHPEFADTEFIHVRAKRIINEVPAVSRVPFRFTINVYRGCSHACSYCFARPTHEYLNLDAGRDFERVIVVKVNAVEALRAELASPRWSGEHIAMGTNTDPYQRAEGRYRLTRGVLEVLTEAANPFSILTKSSLVTRDVDLLVEAAQRTDIGVSFSIGTLDTDVWKATEPGAPHPRSRIEAIAALREHGIAAGVLLAPIIPGISDEPAMIDEVVRSCFDAGARSVSPIVLHLRPGVKEQFLPWLREARPDLVARYDRLYGNRSYAPKTEQARITGLVEEAVARHRHRSPRSLPAVVRPREARRIRTAAAVPPAPPAGEQLSLL